MLFDIDKLLIKLLSNVPADQAWVEDEIERILNATPEINPGYEQPEDKGVVRYDSALHAEADIMRMPAYLRQRVRLARLRNPVGRLVITQTAAMLGDTDDDRRALIAVQRGLHLVATIRT